MKQHQGKSIQVIGIHSEMLTKLTAWCVYGCLLLGVFVVLLFTVISGLKKERYRVRN